MAARLTRAIGRGRPEAQDRTLDGMLIAHLSDTHIGATDEATPRTQRVLAHLDALRRRPDAVLITGDLADHAAEAEYEQLRGLLGERDVLLCPGNHDRRAPYRKVLLGAAAEDGPINSVADRGDARFVLLDSTIPGEDGGRLGDETLAFLADALAATPADRRILIAFHHPPVELHVPFIDEIRQHDAHRLAAAIEPYPNVLALLCGHAHTPAASTFAGRPVLVAPGVVSTLGLPWETEELVDYARPPAIAYHLIDDAGRLTTHYRLVV